MYIYFILFVIQIFTFIISNINIKFNRYLPIINEGGNCTLEQFINFRVKNIYKTEISIGNPPQNIPGFLKTDQYGFYISNISCPVKRIFDKEKSNSIIFRNNDKTFIDSLFLDTSFNSTKNIKLIENFTFSMKNNIQGPICLNIGILLPNLYSQNDKNIIFELNRRKYINSYFFYFKIFSEDELYLVLDTYLNKTDTKYKFIKPIAESFRYFHWNRWGLNFEYLNFNNKDEHFMNRIKTIFDINLGCIIGNSQFKDIFKIFLNENNIFIKPKKIKNYEIYFFDKNITQIENIKNKELKFYHKEFNYNFTLNFKDLIIEKNNGYFFLIIFDFSSPNSWILGLPFLKKYNFIYNIDSKLIGFQENNNGIIYSENNDSNDLNRIGNDKIKKNNINEGIRNKNNKASVFKIIAIIFLSLLLLIIIVLVLGILIGKKLFETRKAKVNELLELYDYSSKQNNFGEKKIQ